MSSSDHSGWAARRNHTCAQREIDCGSTAGPFRACCPEGSFCPANNDVYNSYCCNSNTNCTSTIVANGPYCANTSWTLYDNQGNFCCGAGEEGYKVGTGANSSDGCASPGYNLHQNEHYLQVVSARSKPAQTSSTSSTLGHAAATGAIVGAVIGGVAFIVIVILAGFLLLKYRKRQQQAAESRRKAIEASYGQQGFGYAQGYRQPYDSSGVDMKALNANAQRSELEPQDGRPPAEMDGQVASEMPSQNQISELPAQSPDSSTNSKGRGGRSARRLLR